MALGQLSNRYIKKTMAQANLIQNAEKINDVVEYGSKALC